MNRRRVSKTVFESERRGGEKDKERPGGGRTGTSHGGGRRGEREEGQDELALHYRNTGRHQENAPPAAGRNLVRRCVATFLFQTRF